MATPDRKPDPTLDSDPATWPRTDAGARTASGPATDAGWAFGPRVFTALPNATALLAPSGIVMDVNREWRRLTGDDDGDDAGGPLWRRFAPAERSHISALVERVRDTADAHDARPQVTGTQLRHADGREVDVALHLSATRDKGALILVAQMELLAGQGQDAARRPGTGDRSLALATIARAVATAGDIRRISAHVISAVARATGCPLVGLWRRAGRREHFVLVDGLGFTDSARGNLVLDGGEGGLADHTIRCRGVVVIGGPSGTVAGMPRVLAERGVSSGVAVPLVGTAGADGVLTVSAAHNQPMDPEDIRFLGIVGDLLTMALQREGVDHLITSERQRTAAVARDLELLERRHGLATALHDVREWCWPAPELVTAERRMDPPPRWSAQICLDGGPQALIDCAVEDQVAPLVAAINGALSDADDVDIDMRLLTTDGLVDVHLRGLIERDRRGAVREAWGIASVRSADAEDPARPDDEAAHHLAHTGHDLNNLLAAVLGIAEQLIEQGGDRRRLTAIVRAGRRARELVAGLWRGQAEEHPLADAYELSDVVEQLRPLIHGLVGRDVEVVYKLGRGARTTSPSRGELEHLLLDLVANSRDAVAGTGTLIIATDTCVQVDATGPQAPPPGTWARLRVCDNGSGMTAEDRERIFIAGYTTKAGHEHAGLGLASVRDMVSRAGGAITVDSVLGRGTVVDVHLPLAERAGARLQPLRAPAPADGAATRDPAARTALVVDDEPALRELLPQLLDRLGYDTLVAADGAGALEVAHRLPRLDLLVSDLRMPHKDGLQLAREVRAVHERVGVVLLSGAPPRTPIADRNLRVLHKPFEWNDLRDAVLDLQPQAATVTLQPSLPAVGGR